MVIIDVPYTISELISVYISISGPNFLEKQYLNHIKALETCYKIKLYI